jgi:hypothetical protein
MGYKIVKPSDMPVKVPDKPWREGSRIINWLSMAFVIAIVAWIIHQAWFPTFDPCPACEGTGALSCGAPGCVHGKVTCTGPCLKKESPEWQYMAVAGHGPQEKWIRFNNPDGTWEAWNQSHIGEAIEFRDGRWVNTGPCKVCMGTTRMPCNNCGGTRACEVCGGSGNIRHWLW